MHFPDVTHEVGTVRKPSPTALALKASFTHVHGRNVTLEFLSSPESLVAVFARVAPLALVYRSDVARERSRIGESRAAMLAC